VRRHFRTFSNVFRAAVLVASVTGVAAAASAQAPDAATRIAAYATAAPAPALSGDALPLGRSSASRDVGDVIETDRGGSGGYLLSTAGALGLVIGLVLAARWVVVKVGGRPVAASNSAVELLSRTAVAPKSHVLLLRVGRRVLVVGDAGGELRPLGEIDDADEVADLLGAVTATRSGSATQSFSGFLDRFNRDHDASGQRRVEGADNSEHRTGAALDALSGLKSHLKNLGGA